MSHPKSNESALQTITEKIQKHCPELLELSRGCKLKDDSGQEFVYISKDEVDPTSHFILWSDGRVSNHVAGMEYLSILGHPITLEHVLKARAGIIDVTDTYGMVGGEKSVCLSHFDDQIENDDEWWILGKPLSEQSPETIEWLNSVID